MYKNHEGYHDPTAKRVVDQMMSEHRKKHRRRKKGGSNRVKKQCCSQVAHSEAKSVPMSEDD